MRVIVFLLVLLIASNANAAFSYSRTLTIDHTKCGAVDSTDFPVLVKISDPTFATVANGGHVQNVNGYDIAFYSDSGLTTALKWEIDYYDGVTGVLWAWVKIPTVSSSVDTVFYVGYGDASISTFQSVATDVWSNSFLAVYHFGSGTVLTVTDSTSNAFTLTNNNTATAATGQVAGGVGVVSASSQYLSRANYTTQPAAITLSAYLKATTHANAYASVIGSEDAANNSFINLFVKSTGKLAVYLKTSGGNYDYDGTGTNTLSTGVWYHLAATQSAATGMDAYVNGGLDRHTSAAFGMASATVNLAVGNDPNTANRHINGVIDEARVANVARTVDWLLTESNNMGDPATFMDIGPEDNIGPAPGTNYCHKGQKGKLCLKGQI